jgi:hypothetical protein
MLCPIECENGRHPRRVAFKIESRQQRMPEEAMTMSFVGYTVRAPLTVATIGIDALRAATGAGRLHWCADQSSIEGETAIDCWRGNHCDGPGPVID